MEVMQPISKQWICKHAPTTIKILSEIVFFFCPWKKKNLYVLYLQGDSCNYYVKIRFQDMTSED
jgi:hypothetical protein